jgi:hypothetical protein
MDNLLPSTESLIEEVIKSHEQFKKENPEGLTDLDIMKIELANIKIQQLKTHYDKTGQLDYEKIKSIFHYLEDLASKFSPFSWKR